MADYNILEEQEGLGHTCGPYECLKVWSTPVAKWSGKEQRLGTNWILRWHVGNFFTFLVLHTVPSSADLYLV